ncbi:MAG: carboxymuconolactone decarboxylase family protein [Deltaproteobacteria bacterium]|nr:carboxymuconolactone decarboxylase family protein [Deltaproteobacteria bacterium]
MTDDERASAGKAIQEQLWGEHATGGGPPATRVAPDFFAWVRRACFGDVWSRPGLDLKSRSLATVAQLAALGRTDELRAHLAGALRLGWSRAELVEVLVQTACYAGIPAAVAALNAAEPVLGPSTQGDESPR